MTLLVRDEADILDAQLAFHLNQGIDFIVASDNRSSDETAEILGRLAREGYVHVLRVDGEGFHQAEWVTHMARLAATDFGADWVINADADEFWWPRYGALKEILAALPRRYGIVRGFERHFVPRPDEEGHFAERMTVRVTPYAQQTEPGDPFQGTMAVIHRADPAITLLHGNHDVTSSGLHTLRGWYPIEVLHFPLRTLEQARRKFAHRIEALRLGHTDLGLHALSAMRALGAGRFDEWYASYVVDDAAVEAGVADGSLVVDTRLRDALRGLAGVDELPSPEVAAFPLPAEIPRLTFSRSSLADEARYADEMQVFDSWDSEAKAMHRIDDLERRVDELERVRSVLVARIGALRPARQPS